MIRVRRFREDNKCKKSNIEGRIKEGEAHIRNQISCYTILYYILLYLQE